MKPFIKWVGGKTQLLPVIRDYYPMDKYKITKYCEPFIGGGAVLLDILDTYDIKEVMINDINPELTNLYIQIRDNVEEVISYINYYDKLYNMLTYKAKQLFYYQKRDRFNKLKRSEIEIYMIERASIFILLNKTGFNGLYRVNRKGLFNTPWGKYESIKLIDEDKLRKVSNLLKNVTISTGDYRQCKSFIDDKTFVYMDPPYKPVSTTSSFNSYDHNSFDDNEQIELGKFITKIHNKGAKILLSNSDPDGDFFNDIYKKFNIVKITANRMINSKADKRGSVSELLIYNYKIK